MRALFAASLPQNPAILWWLVGLVALFCGILAWSLRPARSQALEAQSRQPLQD
jgi:hypothetical protein